MAIILINMGLEIKSLLPTLAVFVVATIRLLPSASKMIQNVGKIRYGVPSADLLQKEIHEESLKKYNQITTSSLKNLKFSELKFENVSFKYPSSNKKILDKISLEIKKGEKIGLSANLVLKALLSIF